MLALFFFKPDLRPNRGLADTAIQDCDQTGLGESLSTTIPSGIGPKIGGGDKACQDEEKPTQHGD